MLGRDLSASGIRLVGASSLLGQKVRVLLLGPEGPLMAFGVRILWACPTGPGLIENGGAFPPPDDGKPGGAGEVGSAPL
jgi:hypothetical protein